VKRDYLLAGLSGLLLFFCFPNILGVELGPLAFVALVPLLLALDRADSVRAAALRCGATGLVAFPLTYHWLTHTFTVYAGMGWAVSILVLLLMILVLSGFLMLFGVLHRLLVQDVGWPSLVAAPVAWVGVEFLRTYFPFGGFPWALLAYSQHNFLPLIQMAEWTGPYGVSFLLVMTNAAIASALAILAAAGGRPGGHQRRRLAAALAVLLLPALAAIYGTVRMRAVDRAFQAQPRFTIGIVQANIDQGQKWDEQKFWAAMEDHMALTRKLLPQKPRLIIWPEAAVTVNAFNEHWAKRSQIIDFLAQINAYLLVGSISREPCGAQPCYFNSAYLLSPRAENMLGRYDKMRLVPFGEYVPLKWLFFFADAIAHGNTGSTTPGREIKTMSIPGLVFGCPICYEVIFPNQVRQFVRDGADFMTTITNDAWFGRTGAPYQHHAAVVFRAVENRVYFARAANTGVSSIVDPNGRVLRQTPIYQPASFTGEVRPSPLHTFYTAHGDVFALLCAAPLLFLLSFKGGKIFGKRIRPNG
jgi:apolipoprotein N-acyltransferase